MCVPSPWVCMRERERPASSVCVCVYDWLGGGNSTLPSTVCVAETLLKLLQSFFAFPHCLSVYQKGRGHGPETWQLFLGLPTLLSCPCLILWLSLEARLPVAPSMARSARSLPGFSVQPACHLFFHQWLCTGCFHTTVPLTLFILEFLFF